MIQATPKCVVGLHAPNFVPLALSRFPFLSFLLHSSKERWDDIVRCAEEQCNDFIALLSTIDFEYCAPVDCLALSSKVGRKFEVSALIGGEGRKLLSNGFEQLDRSVACTEVGVIIVALFFDTMQAFFKLILAMSDKAGVFGGPGWVGCPFIVENKSAEVIAAATWFQCLRLWQQAIAWTQPATIRQSNPTGRRQRLILNDLVFWFSSDPPLKPIVEFRIVADEGLRTEHKPIGRTEVLGEEVDEFEELGVLALVSNVLPNAIEKTQLVKSRRNLVSWG